MLQADGQNYRQSSNSLLSLIGFSWIALKLKENQLTYFLAHRIPNGSCLAVSSLSSSFYRYIPIYLKDNWYKVLMW